MSYYSEDSPEDAGGDHYMTASSSSSSSAPLPVFLQPTDAVHFIVNKPVTHKQVLTVYNPYEFAIRFTVLSNNPSKYRVVEPRGFVRPKCYVDIMVRHLSPTLNAAAASSDCLRIEIYREGEQVSCGRKDVLLTVLATDPVTSRHLDSEQFKAFPTAGSGPASTALRARQQQTGSFGGGAPAPLVHNFYWLVIFGFFTCILTLLLPAAQQHLDDQQCGTSPIAAPGSFWGGSLVPSSLRPSATLQLVAAYVLGLLTVYLIQPNQ